MGISRLRFSEIAHFTAKQILATETADAHKYTLFGGSRGPGKSYWLRWYGYRLISILKAPKEKGGQGIPDPVVGLFCENYPVLQDRQISKIEDEFPPELGEVKSTQKRGLGFYVSGGGLLALRNLDKPEKYQSAEFAGILVDELTKNTVRTFDILRGSLRWPGLDPRWLKFAAATNPGSIGHLWVKSYFIDKVYPPELEPEACKFAFVPALPDDNPHLDAEYWHMLETLPPELARAWRWGDWDQFEGQAFGEWRRDLHVTEPFPIPDEWVRWRAIDWGYSAPMCCLWLAKDLTTGLTVVYRELYKAGLTDPEQEIKRLTGSEKIRLTVADPSLWTKVSLEEKTRSTADVYHEHGIRMQRADNSRIDGKRRIHEALAIQEDTDEPGLIVFKNCANLIRTLPALPRDDINPEDVDTEAEDHAYDTLRYGLGVRIGKRPKPKPGGDYWHTVRRDDTPLDQLKRLSGNE
jgi:phage terminase large subunit